jgi:hypothetical protein
MSTLTYLYPGSGTNPATAAQAKAAAIQVAQIAFTDADTTVVVTHNYALDTAALNRGEPLVVIEQLAAGATPAGVISISKATNTITLTKTSTAGGSGGTFQVDIHLPHSILMPNT